MALRSTATTVQASGGSTFAVNMPAGIQVGDTLLVGLNSDGFNQTLTPPGTGYWTQLGTQTGSAPDGETYQLYGRIVDGTEGSTQTWSIAGKGIVAYASAWSGRQAALITSSNVVATLNQTSNTSPVSASLTGVTAATGDDIGVFLGLDVTAAAPTWTASTITGYTNAGMITSGDAALSDFQSQDNVSSGATGSLACTLTRTAGTGNTGYCGFVVNIPKIAAPADTLMGQICL